MIANGDFNLPRGFVFSWHAQFITPTHTRTALIYQFSDIRLIQFMGNGDSEVICCHKVPMLTRAYYNNITTNIALFSF